VERGRGVRGSEAGQMVGETFSLSATPVAKWSKADNLLHGYTNAFLESKDWQTLRDAIAAIDPSANAGGGGLTSQATGTGTVSAELSRLYQAGFVAERGEHNVELLLGNCFCGGRVELALDVERRRGVRGADVFTVSVHAYI